MSLEPARVALAVQGGLSAVCATCERYWQGRERGFPEPKCTALLYCASPLGNDDFSQYKGPMGPEAMAFWCFRCGRESDLALRVVGRDRVIGVCEEHFDAMFTGPQGSRPKMMRAPGLDGGFGLVPSSQPGHPFHVGPYCRERVDIEVLSPKGPPVLLSELRARPRKMTLRELLAGAAEEAGP